MQSFYEMFTSD